jgi:uncharacterized iron-regulated membrane protein
MACCALGALMVATALMWWKRLSAAMSLRTREQLSWAPAVTVIAASLAISGFTIGHLDHYVERARANERALLAEIMAQPICTGAPSSVQAMPVAAATRMDWRFR